jgi:hypothetical protein
MMRVIIFAEPLMTVYNNFGSLILTCFHIADLHRRLPDSLSTHQHQSGPPFRSRATPNPHLPLLRSPKMPLHRGYPWRAWDRRFLNGK